MAATIPLDSGARTESVRPRMTPRLNGIAKPFQALLLALLSVGCAGVSITPISADIARQAHTDKGTVKGYIVYAPIVVVELTEKLICLQQGEKGECKRAELTCSAGTPFVLPDYAKPYAVDIHSGLGKAGADVSFRDGWLLTQVKDASDNTALLGMIEKVLGLDSKKTVEKTSGEPDRRCTEPGLYTVSVTSQGIEMKRIRVYFQKPAPAP